jgi:RecB family exonuclease
VVATQALLASGFQERLHQLLPGIDEARQAARSSPAPVLVVPEDRGSVTHFTWRDREEELVAVLRRLKCQTADRGSGIRDQGSGTHVDPRPPAPDPRPPALVFHRPLPYLYLSKYLCEVAGVPYEAPDALPLAVEPFAAAIDLVCTFVTSGYSRRAAVELLRDPHFVFEHDGARLNLRAVEALDREWQEAGGGRTPRELLMRVGGPAASVALALMEEMRSFEGPQSASEILGHVLAFLLRLVGTPDATEPALAGRERRARAAILGAIESLRQAHVRHDDGETEFVDLVPTIRRWIESQTFTPRTGTSGVVLVDTQAARYGMFSDVSLVGLVEGEWPERRRRNIFYPALLLARLGWPRDRDRSAAERAAFQDLLRLPWVRVAVSTFTLEDDTAVSPSTLLEDVADCGLTREVFRSDQRIRVTSDQALSEEPIVRSAVSGDAAMWLDLRLRRPPLESPGFHGAAGRQPPSIYAVSAVERYLRCPFRYFAAAVLGLKEEREDEPTLTLQARGTVLHRAFEAFYARWQDAGHTSIDVASLDHALAEFTRVVEEIVSELPETDRAAGRAWLLGSAAEPGVAHRLFALEIDSGAPVVERLLEMRLDNEFELVGHDGPRRVRIRGVADRVDLRADGTLRIVDYKTGRAPEPQAALQLPLYGACAEQQLAGYRGRQ